VAIAAVFTRAPHIGATSAAPSARTSSHAVKQGEDQRGFATTPATPVAPAVGAAVPAAPAGAHTTAAPGDTAGGRDAAGTARPSAGALSATVPPGTNIAAADFGGEIESITATYGPGHNGRALTDGTPESVWQPDDNVSYPQDIVISFYKRDSALVSGVVVMLAKDGWGPKNVEVWTSTAGPASGFSQVAAVSLPDAPAVQAITFPPVEARWVKLRVVSGPDAALKIGEVEIIEGSRPGYASLLTRHPEIPSWKTSVRHAAQMGIDWLEPESVEWQNHNRCFGCHVQAQTLMGLAVAQSNNYVVSARAAHDLAEFTRTKQDTDGHEKDEGSDSRSTPTQFAAMGLAYYDESNGTKSDSALRRYVDWLAARAKPTGELDLDTQEPPISQGSLMGTANAVVAFTQAFAETGDPRYKAAADRGLSFIASARPSTTQDKVFTIIVLSRLGTAAQRQLAARVIKQLQSEQNSDGGWRERATMRESNAFATGQALYALKEAGVSITSPAFSNGVRYLLATQQKSGAWPPGTTQAKRPSEFAPTMWAVIGLAGAIEPPTAASLKADLDKYGRVTLYINFDFDKATLRPDAKPILAQVVKLLVDNPALDLAINGHTDNVGAHDYNVQLSERRAAAVVDALAAAHVSRGRLTSGGFGPDQPIADNDTEKGRAKNRRVELVKP
jgi:outer membrane protein OmpA-like peptidoglycan-associated protein